MKKKLFTMMAFAAALCACTKEQTSDIEQVEGNSIPLVFTATMEGVSGIPDTKATFDNSAKCASWELNDQICINGRIYSAEKAGTSTTFSELQSLKIRPFYVSSESKGFSDDEAPRKLVDSEGTSTKWCANKPDHCNENGIWDIIVKTEIPAKLHAIELWNANDTEENPGRRWKDVKVSGSASANGDWSEIKTFENLDLATSNCGLAGTLNVDATQEYEYYKVEILNAVENPSTEIMQMSDMVFSITHNGPDKGPYKACFPENLYRQGSMSLPGHISETWSDGKFNMPMYAYSPTSDLNFKNLCGVLKITVKSDQIAAVKNIRVSSANKAVSGTFTVNDNNAAVLVEPSAVINTLTVTYTDAVPTTAEGKVFYVAIPAQTYQALRIELDADGNGFTTSMTTEASTNIVVDRNKIYPITFADNTLPVGALSGEFSVSATTKVHFSQGNLQATYDGTKYTWGFAANQYDYIGEAAGNTTIDSQSTGNVVDLFGCSTTATYFGINTSLSGDDYSGNFVDWGKNIGDGNTWRTLSNEEWGYLFDTRIVNGGTGKGKSYTTGITYGGKWGLVLYPDDYKGSELSGTVTTLPEGVVFLPAAGYRNSSSVDGVGSLGYYWATPVTSDLAFFVIFYREFIYWEDYGLMFQGQSVRLITESKSNQG